MKNRLWIDSALGTVFILFLIWLIYNVSALGIFDVFDPIGDALGDVEFTDVVFSQLREEPKVDPNVVVVNFGDLSRGEIAAQIEILSKYNPRVIGIDALFYNQKSDTLGDLMLSQSIQNAGNVILVSKLVSFNPNTLQFDSVQLSHPMFSNYADNAFANLLTDNDASTQDMFKITRSFVPQKYIKGDKDKMEVAFGVKLAERYAPEKAERFLKRKLEAEIINYRGNILNPFQQLDFGGKFIALDWDQVLMEDFDSSVIEGNIILMGYLGSNFLDTSWDDKFYTPLNKKYAGKANPDMYGVVIHANIVSMIINEDYIGKLPDWLEHSVGALITFLNIVFFSLIYRRIPKWYDGTTKVIQLIELLLFLFLIIMIFHWFSLKVNITLGMAGIALAGDGLEVFYGVIMNIFSREGRAQLFSGNVD
jgi:CHASE2 domain-containing sensor protein